jgi:hypothetical protein
MVLVGRWSEMPVNIKDPATAQGIADRFRDAECVAEAISQDFSGLRPLADYEETRNLAVMPMYGFTVQLPNLAELPPPQMRQLLHALRGNQTETNRFLGAWAGTVPIPEFFAPKNIRRIVASQPI